MGRYDDYTKLYSSEYADGHYIRKAKADKTRGFDTRDMLIDMKMRQVALDTKRRCEMSLYLPLQTGFEPPPETTKYKPLDSKHKRLYSKKRDKLILL